MTKMQATDDNKSGQSGQSGNSGNSGGSNGSGKKSRKERIAEAADRKAIAKLNRRLAESAGRVLHELILLGSGEVKQKIISAIIATVQQPGSTPPEDVPALMTILRSAAEEQLTLVQELDSLSALLSAIEFGRWIKVPTIKLGEARKNFMSAQEARKRQVRNAAGAVPSAPADTAASAEAPAAEPLREGDSPPQSRRKKKKDSASTRKLKAIRRITTKQVKAKLDRHNARSQQKLAAFKVALANQSRHYQTEKRRLMSPSPILVSSIVYSTMRVDAEAHFMAQEAYAAYIRASGRAGIVPPIALPQPRQVRPCGRLGSRSESGLISSVGHLPSFL